MDRVLPSVAEYEWLSTPSTSTIYTHLHPLGAAAANQSSPPQQPPRYKKPHRATQHQPDAEKEEADSGFSVDQTADSPEDEDVSATRPPARRPLAGCCLPPASVGRPGQASLLGRRERDGPRPPAARPGPEGARGQDQGPDEGGGRQAEGLQRHGGRAGAEAARTGREPGRQAQRAGGEGEVAGGAGPGGEGQGGGGQGEERGLPGQNGEGGGEGGGQRQRSQWSPVSPGEEGDCSISNTRRLNLPVIVMVIISLCCRPPEAPVVPEQAHRPAGGQDQAAAGQAGEAESAPAGPAEEGELRLPASAVTSRDPCADLYPS